MKQVFTRALAAVASACVLPIEVSAQATAVGASSAPVSSTARGPADIRTTWLDRPWELRFVLFVAENWELDVKGAHRRNEKAIKAGSLDLEWESYFDAKTTLPFSTQWGRPGTLSVVLIEFDKDGSVKTPHRFPAPLRGRLDRLMYVALTPGDHATQPRFNLDKWFLGLGDVSTHWAPSLCPLKQMPSPFSQTDTLYLYGPKHEQSPYSPSVGCREWAYQLEEPSRRYIDITSYLPKRLDPKGSGTYVRDTVGWARFDSEVKPIIGKHEELWYCFHDCPGGEAPGPIADIKAWAAKQGWKPPKRPTRVPVFPDPPARPGTYPE